MISSQSNCVHYNWMAHVWTITWPKMARHSRMNDGWRAVILYPEGLRCDIYIYIEPRTKTKLDLCFKFIPTEPFFSFRNARETTNHFQVCESRMKRKWLVWLIAILWLNDDELASTRTKLRATIEQFSMWWRRWKSLRRKYSFLGCFVFFCCFQIYFERQLSLQSVRWHIHRVDNHIRQWQPQQLKLRRHLSFVGWNICYC